MGQMKQAYEEWQEEQDRKIALFLDLHAPELSEPYRILTGASDTDGD